MRHSAQTFFAGGWVARISAPAHPSRPCAQAFCRSSPPAGTQSISLLPNFSHRLATVAGMAKALKIAAIHEHCPVSAVRLDVVHFRGRCPDSVPGTLPAKRLTKELAGPQVLRPLWGQVHPVPGLGFVAAVILWPVAVAVAAGDQGRTPRVPTWAQRLVSHGLSPPGKNKKPAPTRPPFADHVAQALWHRHSSIFTMDSFPQSLQYTVKLLALVSGLSRRTFPRPHRGQSSHPSFAISLTRSLLVCNGFSSLSPMCAYRSTRFQD